MEKNIFKNRKCHRELKDEKSKKLGFGPICYKKYLQKSKTYLFEMENDEMFLNKEDIIKFHELNSRFDSLSSNIGVVGDYSKFKNLTKELLKKYKKLKNVRIIINEEKTKLTIIQNDLEINYIHIRELNDLRGRFFRKYI